MKINTCKYVLMCQQQIWSAFIFIGHYNSNVMMVG